MTLVATAPTASTTSTRAEKADGADQQPLDPCRLRRVPVPASASGAVKPSMIPKIQTSAATLMTSGTVTKKPVRSRRRSHGITATAPTSPRRSPAPAAIRYQANGAKPERDDIAQKRLDHDAAPPETP